MIYVTQNGKIIQRTQPLLGPEIDLSNLNTERESISPGNKQIRMCQWSKVLMELKS